MSNRVPRATSIALTNHEQSYYTGVDVSWTIPPQWLSNLSIQPERTLRTSRVRSRGNANSTACDSTGTQRSISTGISAGQGPRYVRSSSIVVGRYRMSFSKARYYGKLRGSRGSDPRHLRLTMNRLLDCTSQERPSTSSFVCVARVRPFYVTITLPGSIDPYQLKRRAPDLDAINWWPQMQFLTM